MTEPKRIQQLDDLTIGHIAAGEVVERGGPQLEHRCGHQIQFERAITVRPCDIGAVARP